MLCVVPYERAWFVLVLFGDRHQHCVCFLAGIRPSGVSEAPAGYRVCFSVSSLATWHKVCGMLTQPELLLSCVCVW